MGTLIPTKLQDHGETDELSEETYSSFYEALKLLGIDDLKACDKATARRFLRARNNKVDKASKMFYEHLKWKENFLPNGRILESDVQSELESNKLFLQVKKDHQPVLIAWYKNHNAKHRDLEEFKRFSVYAVYKVVDCLPPGKEKFLGICDMHDAGLANFDVSAMIAAFDILQNHYPERLQTVFMVHVPYLFWGFWKLVEPFLDKVTRKKIVFVEDNKLEETLLSRIPSDMLPSKYGGSGELVPIHLAQVLNYDKESEVPMRKTSIGLVKKLCCLRQKT